MTEPFKLLINADVVRAMGRHLDRVWPDFDRARFEREGMTGLDALELKARVAHLAEVLARVLPADFHRAADVLEASLRPPIDPAGDPDRSLGLLVTNEEGLAGWALWPMGDYVARHGLAHPERALQCLHALTQRNTAEFALRPFIAEHPDLSWRTLQRWVNDPSAHVRRLVSEGSRPRLPWGLQLKALVVDPSPTLPLLRALQDDPSAYVRRSVANHLNDIAKDHPALVEDWLREHLPEASPERLKLLRHASRTLIKKGHAGVLQAWGLGEAFDGQARLRLTARHARVGETLGLAVTLTSRSGRAQRLEMDYVVHHVKADGSSSPKVFKGRRLSLAAGETLHWTKAHALRPVSTRRYFDGEHRVQLQVNGRVVAEARFDLKA